MHLEIHQSPYFDLQAILDASSPSSSEPAQNAGFSLWLFHCLNEEVLYFPSRKFIKSWH